MNKKLYLLTTLSTLISATAFGHGSMEIPISRVYNCFKEGPEAPKSAACKAAASVSGPQMFYDWNGINQLAGGNHKNFVPDGELCGGGKPLFQGLNLGRNDWPTSTVAPDTSGNFQFVYRATAPHASLYHQFYITKDGYDHTQPLKWSDLEATPFCQLGSVPLDNGYYKMKCPLPQNKVGKYIIYHIWQRSDSQESFYSCSDVMMLNGTSNWNVIGQIYAPRDLAVGSSVILRLFDASGADVERHSITLTQNQTSSTAWPFT
jgi:chitin-binding protein